MNGPVPADPFTGLAPFEPPGRTKRSDDAEIEEVTQTSENSLPRRPVLMFVLSEDRCSKSNQAEQNVKRYLAVTAYRIYLVGPDVRFRAVLTRN